MTAFSFVKDFVFFIVLFTLLALGFGLYAIATDREGWMVGFLVNLVVEGIGIVLGGYFIRAYQTADANRDTRMSETLIAINERGEELANSVKQIENQLVSSAVPAKKPRSPHHTRMRLYQTRSELAQHRSTLATLSPNSLH